MSDRYVIAMDVGTSGMKVVLIDDEANVVASERGALWPKFPKEGWAESDPEEWWQTGCRICKSLLAKTGIDPEKIVGVGFDAAAYGFIPVKAGKGCLYPDIIWLDFISEDTANEMNDKLAAHTGDPDNRPWTSKDCLPKILWVKKHLPEIWDEMDCFLPDSSYLVYKATGKLVSSSQNAFCYGYDFAAHKWDMETLSFYGIEEEKLPPVIDAADVVGGLTEEAAAELGLPTGIPVTAGFSDCNAMELGSGCVNVGDAALYVGTSMLYSYVTDDNPPPCPESDTFPSSNKAHNMLFATNDMSGGCIDWIIDKLFDPGSFSASMEHYYEEAGKMIDETPPGADGLFFTTTFQGERQPICDNYVRAGFWNLNPEHGRSHMMRAVHEGVAYQIRWTLEAIDRKYGISHKDLVLSGGGARSSHLAQIIADVTGITIHVQEDPQFSVAKGTAFLSFIAAGVMTFDDVKKYIHIAEVCKPNPDNKDVYDRGARFYQRFYETTKDFFKDLNG